MLSHDSKLRCDFVDLYYKLYGVKRPTCLPIPELAGILKPQKVYDEIKKKPPHFSNDSKPSTSGFVEVKKETIPMEKDDPSNIIIEENVDCINVEVIAKEDRFIKVRIYNYVLFEIRIHILLQQEPIEIKSESITKQEYFSDNSVSLPGLMGLAGPVGFEPGMFKKEGEAKHKSDPTKVCCHYKLL